MSTNFTKTRKGRNKGLSFSFNKVIYCTYGIKSYSIGRLTKNNIESGRKVIIRYIRKFGKLVIRVFPNKPLTKKPNEVRMGNGKGDIETVVFNVKPGHIIYEFDCFTDVIAYKILRLVSIKLPIKVSLVYRDFFLNLTKF